jgi:hypothetical protein
MRWAHADGLVRSFRFASTPRFYCNLLNGRSRRKPEAADRGCGLPLSADFVEKLRKRKSIESIGLSAVSASNFDSQRWSSLNHYFV